MGLFHKCDVCGRELDERRLIVQDSSNECYWASIDVCRPCVIDRWADVEAAMAKEVKAADEREARQR